jgi:hypothetical protein
MITLPVNYLALTAERDVLHDAGQSMTSEVTTC